MKLTSEDLLSLESRPRGSDLDSTITEEERTRSRTEEKRDPGGRGEMKKMPGIITGFEMRRRKKKFPKVLK